jgi:hypothetical protein
MSHFLQQPHIVTEVILRAIFGRNISRTLIRSALANALLSTDISVGLVMPPSFSLSTASTQKVSGAMQRAKD